MNPTVIWHPENTPVDLMAALAKMDEIHNEIKNNNHSPGYIWLLEHPSFYTGGTDTRPQDWRFPQHTSLPFPFYPLPRGGRVTYHGPGQRIVYLMINLREYAQDIHLYIHFLQTWILEALKLCGITGFTHPDRIGVWVIDNRGQEVKIAALGVHVRRWITSHGISINIDPDLDHYHPIIPCGLDQYDVTSLRALGNMATKDAIDEALRQTLPQVVQEIYGKHLTIINFKGP